MYEDYLLSIIWYQMNGRLFRLFRCDYFMYACALEIREVMAWLGFMHVRKSGSLHLPPTLTSAHDVFHVFMLKKYIPDASHKIDFSELKIQEDMSYIEKPLKILDTKERVLRTKTIPMVKVLWRNHAREEATWEVEDDMRKKYPELFL